MTRQPNIVQLEFTFLPNNLSLDDVMKLTYERAIESGSAKVVLRLPDHDGTLTELTKQNQSVSFLIEWIDMRYAKAGRLGKLILKPWYSALHKKERQLEPLLPAQRAALHALKSEEKLAIENPDWSFRYVQPNERHELMERVIASQKVLVFVFRPMDLCGDHCHLLYSHIF